VNLNSGIEEGPAPDESSCLLDAYRRRILDSGS